MDSLLQRPRLAVDADPVPDVVQLLRREYAEIRQLFDVYDDLLVEAALPAARQETAARICQALALHAVVKEEVIYPVARQWPACRRCIAEAEVEHAAARSLIDELALLEPDDLLFDAHVRVLGEYMRHHFAAEEAQLLPALVRLADELPQLAAEALRRRHVLQQEFEAIDRA